MQAETPNRRRSAVQVTRTAARVIRMVSICEKYFNSADNSRSRPCPGTPITRANDAAGYPQWIQSNIPQAGFYMASALAERVPGEHEITKSPVEGR